MLGGYAYSRDRINAKDLTTQNSHHIKENAKQITSLATKATEATKDIEYIKESQQKSEKLQERILEELQKLNGSR